MKSTLAPSLILLLIILFLTIAISIGGLNFSYSIVNPHNKAEVSNPPGLIVDTGISYYILLFFLYFLIALAIVGGIILRKRLAGTILEEIISGFLGLLITIGLFMGVIFLANRVTISTSSNSVEPVNGIQIGVIIFYASVILLLGIMFYAVLRNVKRRGKEEKVEKVEAKKYVEQAIYSVKLGDDVRSAILRAYKEMENMVHELRASEKKHYTPREFEEFVLKNFKVPEEELKILVSLFETARYSPHEMSEDDREKAISALEAIKNELS